MGFSVQGSGMRLTTPDCTYSLRQRHFAPGTCGGGGGHGVSPNFKTLNPRIPLQVEAMGGKCVSNTCEALLRRPFCFEPPLRQLMGKLMVSLVNSHTNATRIGWHLWEIDLRFAPGLPPGWFRSASPSYSTLSDPAAGESVWQNERCPGSPSNGGKDCWVNQHCPSRPRVT